MGWGTLEKKAHNVNWKIVYRDRRNGGLGV